MKKDYNSKKKVTIAALSLVAVCLVVGLVYVMGTMNNEPPALPVESKPPVETEIVVPEIKPENKSSEKTTIVVPEVKLEGKPSDDSSAAGDTKDTFTDINVEKPSDDKPKTPEEATPPAEQPKTEDDTDRTPPPAQSGKDHKFTPEAPDKQPEYKPEQTTPIQEAKKPKDGDIKDGKIYIEGFGWIKDEGKNRQGSAPNAGTGKPVGDM